MSLLPLDHYHSTQLTWVSAPLWVVQPTSASEPLHLLLHFPGSFFSVLPTGLAPSFLIKILSLILPLMSYFILIVISLPPLHSFSLPCLFLFSTVAYHHLLYIIKEDLISYHSHWKTETNRGSIYNYAEITNSFSSVLWECKLQEGKYFMSFRQSYMTTFLKCLTHRRYLANKQFLNE